MSTPAAKRLMAEFKRLQQDPAPGASCSPLPDTIMMWQAIIFGAPDTPFEDGCFQLSMEFTEQYPMKPPAVRFVTKMFHPNIYENGEICIDILQEKWSAAYNIHSILTSILSLLTDPNVESPANREAARMYRDNRSEYDAYVKQCIDQSFVSQ